jgi:hypothetical protein
MKSYSERRELVMERRQTESPDQKYERMQRRAIDLSQKKGNPKR